MKNTGVWGLPHGDKDAKCSRTGPSRRRQRHRRQCVLLDTLGGRGARHERATPRRTGGHELMRRRVRRSMSTGRPLPGVPELPDHPRRVLAAGAKATECAPRAVRGVTSPRRPAHLPNDGPIMPRGGSLSAEGERTRMGPAAHSPCGPQKRLTPASPNVETDKRARGSGVANDPAGHAPGAFVTAGRCG
jgi:hypothetical protein